MRSSIVFDLLVGFGDTAQAPDPPAEDGCMECDVRENNAHVTGSTEIARVHQMCRGGSWDDCAPINDGEIDEN